MDNNVTFTIVHPVTEKQTPVRIIVRKEKALLQIEGVQLSISIQQMLELGSLLVAMAQDTGTDGLDYDSIHELLEGFDGDATSVFKLLLKKLEE